jgi:hypothetical protein
MRHYRWSPKAWRPLPYLLSAPLDSVVKGERPPAPLRVSLGPLAGGQSLLESRGELIQKGEQRLGFAKIEGAWTQTVFHPDGHVLYAAGAVLDEPPKAEWLPRLQLIQSGREAALARAEAMLPDFLHSARRFPAELRLRHLDDGSFQALWRITYLPMGEDAVRFLEIGPKGEILARGEEAVSGLDGKANVFPQGPKFSQVTEGVLHELNGDGSVSGTFLHITSALNLDVNQPNLLFFFPDSDRRFDFGQVYFAMEQGLLWMRDKVGAALKAPLEVRLHIGDNGVSNAAFYHGNTVYLGTGDGVTYKDMIRDPSVVIHESMHAIIDTYAGLPPDGEGGAFNEGFADLFTALILQNPRMGENSYLGGPFRRTLENNFKAYKDFVPGVYQNGDIIAGTFWDLRPVLGDDKLAQLAFRTLTRLGQGGQFADFIPALANAASGLLTADEQSAVMAAARNRGWAVTQ